MSPRKRHILVEVLSVVLPDAASQTMAGKMTMTHADSNTPLRLNWLSQ